MAALKGRGSSGAIARLALRRTTCLRIMSKHQREDQDDQSEQRAEHNQCAHDSDSNVLLFADQEKRLAQVGRLTSRREG